LVKVFATTGSMPIAARPASVGGEDGADHRAGDGHLSKLEGDGAGVTDDAGADLDRPLGMDELLNPMTTIWSGQHALLG